MDEPITWATYFQFRVLGAVIVAAVGSLVILGTVWKIKWRERQRQKWERLSE
jgi:hypothetical protein